MAKKVPRSDRHVDRYRLHVDGRAYAVHVLRRVSLDETAPRLLVVAHQPNDLARNIVRVCVLAIQRYTPEPHELWIIDNNSPRGEIQWLLEWPRINVAFNRTEPLPKEGRSFWGRRPKQQGIWGSYANAIGLEIGVRLVDPGTRYLMTLHMDTMPCRTGWLTLLRSRIDVKVKGAGVRMDRIRRPEGVLHVLGFMVDFQLWRELNLDFLPRLPEFDVGDKATVRIREAGYDVFALRNSLWEPNLVATLPDSSPFRHFPVDRCFDEEGEVVFLHLGRGIKKSAGEKGGNATPLDWIRFAERHLLS